MIFQSIYYQVFRNWYPLHIIGITGAVILILLIFLLPESPKYLYAKKNFSESRASLKVIQSFNIRDASIRAWQARDFVFDGEQTGEGYALKSTQKF
mmetsp:Transcript_19476/g.33110  ORF Transcript_19476/g.33110 Transcript_19476/m.33110 type:complete len:96 (-) Transcript_19476:295-582(-)